VNFQSSQAKQKRKIFPQNLIKSWVVTKHEAHGGEDNKLATAMDP
jgi:hypothetical protein